MTQELLGGSCNYEAVDGNRYEPIKVALKKSVHSRLETRASWLKACKPEPRWDSTCVDLFAGTGTMEDLENPEALSLAELPVANVGWSALVECLAPTVEFVLEKCTESLG